MTAFAFGLILSAAFIHVTWNYLAKRAGAGGAASIHMVPAMRIGFSALVLIGLWLTYVGWFTKPPEG